MSTSAPVSISAAYGLGMTFAIELAADGTFAFALAGNTLPLFPLAELGRWQGSDPARVAHLCEVIASASTGAADNASKRPDSAYVFVKHSGDPTTKRMFDLYAPPPAWSPAWAELLQTVHQVWVTSRERTVAASARWLTPVVTAAESAVLLVELTNTGREPVELQEPFDSRRWSLVLEPEGLGPDAADAYDGELGQPDYELKTAQQGASALVLRPGEIAPVQITLRRRVAPGRYHLVISASAQVVGEAFRKAGLFTIQPPALVVQS